MICAPISGAITQTPDGARFSVRVEDLRVIVEARGEIGSFLTENTDIFLTGKTYSYPEPSMKLQHQ